MNIDSALFVLALTRKASAAAGPGPTGSPRLHSRTGRAAPDFPDNISMSATPLKYFRFKILSHVLVNISTSATQLKYFEILSHILDNISSLATQFVLKLFSNIPFDNQ